MNHPLVRIQNIVMVPVSKLVPHPKNPNKHPVEQIKRLASIIEWQGWRRAITVSNLSGFITVGHGRLEAAKFKGWSEVPVSYQDYENAAAEYADMVADNAIDDWAELDIASINSVMTDFGPDFDIDLLGIKDFTLDVSEKSEDGENPYTKKIEIPLYTPKGTKPDISQLIDLAKTKKLIDEISASDIPGAEKEFLKFAASRHLVFDYEQIAEYYAHSSPKTQDLFEKSALVIIDFDKAIENGFVQLTKKLAEEFANTNEQ